MISSRRRECRLILFFPAVAHSVLLTNEAKVISHFNYALELGVLLAIMQRRENNNDGRR